MAEYYGLQARITAQPGRGRELIDLLIAGTGSLQSNAACLIHVVSRLPEDPDSLRVTEIWTTKQAHDESLQDPTVQEAIKEGLPLIAGFEAQELAVAGGKGV